MSRALVAALGTNLLLLAHIWGLTRAPLRRLRRWLCLLQRKQRGAPPSPPTPPPPNEALGGLLGRDYTPPLPKPVVDALDRSCLCFLATASQSLEPHLSLMRYTVLTRPSVL